MTEKKILYIDMDNTLVDFSAKLGSIAKELQLEYEGKADEIPGIFALMPPMPGAIEAYRTLSEKFDTYILSTAPWENPSAWQHKIEWVRLHLGAAEGSPAWKRLILSHHKNLNHGDFLVDDRDKNGAGAFEGELIRFGTERFEDWPAVTKYLLDRAEPERLSKPITGSVAELSLEERRDQVSRASAIASIAHRCQKDKLGVAYIEHPKAVADPFDADTQTLEHCAGLLHDVLEDTIYSPTALADAGINEEIIAVVELLTRRKDVDGDAYYAAIRANPAALAVKESDIRHNTHLDRVKQLEPETREKLRKKYEHALDVLGRPWPWSSDGAVPVRSH